MTNTMYDNWSMFVRCEINRLLKHICLCSKMVEKYENVYIFHITLCELEEEITVRVNFDEFRHPNEIITSIINEVKEHINTSIILIQG